MKPALHKAKRFTQILLLLIWGTAPASLRADLELDLFFAPLGGGIFQYDLTVRNTGPDDVSIVSIIDAPANDLLIPGTLNAPLGFLAFYDPLGFIDLLEDTSLFGAGVTTSGFSFQSATSAQANFMTFEALTTNGDFLTGPITLVPEPQSAAATALILCGVAALVIARKKRSIINNQ